MLKGLLDSSVLVDIIRGYPPALTWIQHQNQLGVTRFVWLELLQGATDKQAEAYILRLLKRFKIVPTTEEDITWAVQALLQNHLSHNVGALDALIAATS
jgi:predicted nucleic acid-binding protein